MKRTDAEVVARPFGRLSNKTLIEIARLVAKGSMREWVLELALRLEQAERKS